jgi:hypothetical protein
MSKFCTRDARERGVSHDRALSEMRTPTHSLEQFILYADGEGLECAFVFEVVA